MRANQTFLITVLLLASPLHCGSSYVDGLGSADPFLVVETLFRRAFSKDKRKQLRFKLSAPPARHQRFVDQGDKADADPLSATSIASSATWLRVCLPVVIAPDQIALRAAESAVHADSRCAQSGRIYHFGEHQCRHADGIRYRAGKTKGLDR